MSISTTTIGQGEVSAYSLPKAVSVPIALILLFTVFNVWGKFYQEHCQLQSTVVREFFAGKIFRQLNFRIALFSSL